MIDRHRRDPESDPRLREAAQLLDTVARQEESIRAEAEGLADAPGSDRVEEILATAWSETDGAGGGPRRLRTLAVALTTLAAAVLVIAVFRAGDTGPDRPGPSGRSLGDDDFQLLHPQGRVTDWNVIEWSGPRGARYVLRVLDAADNSTVYGPQPTLETRQELSREITEKWPEKIVIELEMRHGDGTPEYRVHEAELAPR